MSRHKPKHDFTVRLTVWIVNLFCLDFLLLLGGFIEFEFARFIAGWLILLFFAAFIASVIVGVQESKK